MELPSGLGVITTDCDLIVRSWNLWLASASGVDESRAVGRSIVDLVAPERVQVVRELLREVIESGASRVLAPAFHHYLIDCPTSEPSSHFSRMQQRVTCAPLSRDTTVVGVMITIEDVTARLDAERDVASRLRSGDGPPADVLIALGSDDWRVRDAGIRTLRQPALDEVRHLIASVQRDHQDLNVLNSALRVLIATGRGVTQALVDLLGDPAPNVRMHAALALGELGCHEGVPALLRALDDDDSNVRFHAIEALGKCGAAEAVDPLAQIAMSGDFFLAFAAIDALARTEDTRVAAALIPMLDDASLRSAVIDTLGAIGDESCVSSLARLINQDEASVPQAAAAIGRIRDRYESELAAGACIERMTVATLTPEGIGRLCGSVDRRHQPLAPMVAVLGWIGPAGVDTLLRALVEPSLRALASESILALGADAVPPLLAALDATGRDERLAVVALLGSLGDRRAVTRLIELLSSADVDLVASASAALAAIGDPRALDGLLELFGHDHPLVRRAAIAAINSIGADPGGRTVCSRMAHHSPWVRESAVRVAGYFGYPECLDGIVAALQDDHEDVRRAAIEQLPNLDDPRVLPALARALREETPRNRGAAAHAAGRSDQAEVSPLLRASLDDEDAWVRYFAVTSLQWRSDRGAADKIAALALNDPAMHVRIASLRALVDLEPAKAWDIAVNAVDHDDEDLASAAVEALAAGQGPESEERIGRVLQSTRLALRSSAVQAAVLRGSVGAVELLGWAARLDEPAGLRQLAISGLRAIASGSSDGRAHAVQALVALAAEPATQEPASSAFMGLGGEVADDVAPALESPAVAVRLAAIRALFRMRRPEASHVMMRALEDGDPHVREAAIAAFGKLGTRPSAPAILNLLATDPDERVRRRAAAVCARHQWART